ncbi:MAG: flagellar hook protein FlgE [Deltaproteobacteria bacterium]|nr:flagellar hook protein FlgE [Deltaproteobacteria bacterium]MBW2069726.1 flagellar hook protein FlgE [Deltaproteobacteria bacterium]
MSISSSLYSGISGLNVLGNSMAVIGDNIANVNTVAFKSSRVTFQDLLAQNVSVASGSAQIGRGSRLSDISATFDQGSFENTSEPTDLAIGGSGFFILENRDTGDRYYTRAGQFKFDQEGYLVNPERYVVQGWRLDAETGEDQGDITDIHLNDFSSPPQETNLLQLTTNLDSRRALDTVAGANLASKWDASLDPPLTPNDYAYQTSINIYDSLGSEHTLTLYFDRTDANDQYEFLVTTDPGKDQNQAAKGALAGVYMRGIITYDANGNLASLSNLETKDNDPTNWTAATFGTNNYPQFTVDFGQGPQTIELNLGLYWNGTGWARDANFTSTKYASSSTTIGQSQNGYGPGFLQSVSVDTDGIMVGHYSNGQVTPLYRVALANFNNPWDLTKKGGNLFAASQRTGDPSTGHPGTNGLGTIASNALEQSNVDLADQFVKMIIFQRGFQANSRIITTTDTMLQELINLKR